MYDLVKEFHRKYGFPIDQELAGSTAGTHPANGKLQVMADYVHEHALDLDSMIWSDVRVQRARLILEETSELLDALARRDAVDLADALADLLYVIYGTAVSYGIPVNDVFREVHRSNMTKDVGKFKPTKGPTYSPPNIVPILVDAKIPGYRR